MFPIKEEPHGSEGDFAVFPSSIWSPNDIGFLVNKPREGTWVGIIEGAVITGMFSPGNPTAAPLLVRKYLFREHYYMKENENFTYQEYYEVQH